MEPTNTTPPQEDTPHPAQKRWRFLGVGLLALVIVALAIVVLLRVADTSNSVAEQAAQTVQVEIQDSAFSPATVKIKPGQSVVWVNQGASPHQIAADPYPSHDSLPELDSEESLAQGESYTFIFEKAGTYTYHDSLHPTELKGTVIVEE